MFVYDVVIFFTELPGKKIAPPARVFPIRFQKSFIFSGIPDTRSALHLFVAA